MGPPVFTPYPDQFFAIQLNENIPESHNTDDEYDGLLREWDPSQDSNKGAYVTGSTAITLRDTLELGIYGDSGAKGVARLRFDGTGKPFYELWGLECP